MHDEVTSSGDDNDDGSEDQTRNRVNNPNLNHTTMNKVLSSTPLSSASQVDDTADDSSHDDEFGSNFFCCCYRKGRSSSSNKNEKGGLTCHCNFMFTFVMIAILQVALACVLVWLIGYRATNSTANELTTKIRSEVLRNALNEMDDKLGTPLHAAHALRYMTQQRFPDFGSRLNISSETGWLADIAFVQGFYSSVSRVSIMNRHQLVAGMIRPFSNGRPVPLSSSGEVLVELAEPPTYGVPSVVYHQHISTPIRPTVYAPPVNVDAEISGTDSPETIRQFMGQSDRSFNFTLFNRPYWLAGEQLSSSGHEGGWSTAYWTTYSTLNKGYVTLAAVSTVADPVNGGLSWMSSALLSSLDLYEILSNLELGQHGSAYLIRPEGRCFASSRLELAKKTEEDRIDLDMNTSEDEWLQILYHTLYEWGLVTNVPVTSTENVTHFLPYRNTIYEHKLSKSGGTWLIQARMVSNTSANLPFTLVLVTKDDDFNGNVRDAMITTIWLSAVVGSCAILLSILLAKCITSPLMTIVEYMDKAVTVIEMDRSESQRAALARLCEHWSGDIQMYLPSVKGQRGDNEGALDGGGHINGNVVLGGRMVSMVSIESSSSLSKKSTSVVSSSGGVGVGVINRDYGCEGFNLGRNMHEVHLMERAFGSVLYSLASYDELEVINQAKRQFIRYIFHEVRVPFNAIVLGIEQLQLELKTLSGLTHTMYTYDSTPSSGINNMNLIDGGVGVGGLNTPPTKLSQDPGTLLQDYRTQLTDSFDVCHDTLSILREQSDVVSHILNDVLSFQKIEDGALVLEVDTFSFENMLRSAIYAFRSVCLEKKIQVDLKMDQLDHIINQHRGYIPHLGRENTLLHTNMVLHDEIECLNLDSDSKHGPTASFGLGPHWYTPQSKVSRLTRGAHQHQAVSDMGVGGNRETQPSQTSQPSPPPPHHHHHPHLPHLIHPYHSHRSTSPIHIPQPIELGLEVGSPTITGGFNEQQQPQQHHDPATITPAPISYHAQVKADNYRLRQCISNFLSNAIKFTPLEGIVSVRLEFMNFLPSSPVTPPPAPIQPPPSQLQPQPSSSPIDTIVDLSHELAASIPLVKEVHQNFNKTSTSDQIQHSQPTTTNITTTTTTTMAATMQADMTTLAMTNDDEEILVEKVLGSITMRVSVRDTGVGILKEQAKNLFKPYMQLDANKNQAGSGTGLGLSISKSIVELHGGRIGVESEFGVGSEFWFEIPVPVILVEGNVRASPFCNASVGASGGVGTGTNSGGSVWTPPTMNRRTSGTTTTTTTTHHKSNTSIMTTACNKGNNGQITNVDEGMIQPNEHPDSGHATMPVDESFVHVTHRSTQSSSSVEVSSRSSPIPPSFHSPYDVVDGGFSLGPPPIVRRRLSIHQSIGSFSSPSSHPIGRSTPPPPPALDSNSIPNHQRTYSTPTPMTSTRIESPTRCGTQMSHGDVNVVTGLSGVSVASSAAQPLVGRRQFLPSSLFTGFGLGESHLNLLPILVGPSTSHSPAQNLSNFTTTPIGSRTNTPISANYYNNGNAYGGGGGGGERNSPNMIQMMMIENEQSNNNRSNNNLNGTTSNHSLPNGGPIPFWSIATTTQPTPVTTPNLTPAVPATPPPPPISSLISALPSSVLQVAPASSSSSSSFLPSPHLPLPSTIVRRSATPTAPLNGLKVLVVEDSQPNRKLLLSILKHMKCQPEGVENGKLCIDRFPNQYVQNQPIPFDLIIM